MKIPILKRCDQVSARVYIDWVNALLPGSKVKSVEGLGSGVIYCHIMNIISPGCIDKGRITSRKGRENDNYKLIDKALKQLKTEVEINKIGDVNRAIKGGFKDNYNLIFWFYSLFQANVKSKKEKSMVSAKVNQKPKQLVYVN